MPYLIRSAVAVLALTVASAEKPDGTCGYQCTADAACAACGAAGTGKCSCPNGQDTFYATSCTCVSSPPNPPAAPASSIDDTVWPQKWTAEVDAWCYKDFSDTTAVAKGKFYYDSVLQRTRADWSPYINGKDAKQVWVADLAKGTSKYYVKTGPICISFAITDPGVKGLVGVERPDWMKKCNEAGMAKFIGREQVVVGQQREWVDHWSCHVAYEQVNQSITFQSWHSLGLGQVAHGLPVRVTGGNSAPNPTKGSPRLNTVWYSNFVTGDSATSAQDFQVPNFGICIPVGESQVQEFFGREVSSSDVFSPEFHRRAHHLPHASAAKRDLVRAKTKVPGNAFLGKSFEHAMQQLNDALKGDAGLKLRACSDFPLDLLHKMQRALFDARTPELDAVYQTANDTRRMAHEHEHSLAAEQEMHRKLEVEDKQLFAKARDGVCHEMVMWYIHHLSASAREEIKERLVLPMLPEVLHGSMTSGHGLSEQVHGRYGEQVSCAICHVAPADNTIVNV